MLFSVLFASGLNASGYYILSYKMFKEKKATLAEFHHFIRTTRGLDESRQRFETWKHFFFLKSYVQKQSTVVAACDLFTIP